MLSAWFALALSAMAVLSHPSPVPVLGTILDHHDRPVPGAVVFLEKEAQGAVTDGSGGFAIEVPGPGTYRIHVRAAGLLPRIAAFAAEGAGAESLSIRLDATPEVLDQERWEETAHRARLEYLAARKPAAGGPCRPVVPPLSVEAGRCPPGTVCGTVKDSRETPLAFANMVLLGTNWGAMSQPTGEFSLGDIPPGRYTLNVTYLGYESMEHTFDHTTSSTYGIHFALSETVVDTLGIVRVEAGRERIEIMSASIKHAVAGETLERLPVDTFQGSVGLKAGVVSQNGQVHFHGERDKSAGYRIDGPPVTRVPAPQPQRSQVPGTPFAPAPADPPAEAAGQDLALDSMFFRDHGTRPFLDPRADAVVTFAADVDRASYTLTRGLLTGGRLPPRPAVRVEEFVNSVPHGYEAPADGEGFAIHLDAAPSPFREGKILLRVGLKARAPEPLSRKPLRLTLVVDESGSMADAGRMTLARSALGALLDQLGSRDQVGIVCFNNGAWRALEPGHDLAAARAVVAGLDPKLGTDVEMGLQAGYAMAEEMFARDAVNRIVFFSDGVSTNGAGEPETLLPRIRAAAGKGIQLTALGVAMGGVNDALLERMADQADGNYYYLDSQAEVSRVFGEGFLGAMQVVAADVKIQVEMNPAAVALYRLIGYENRALRNEDFRDDARDAGEVGAGHEVTAIFELELVPASSERPLATVRVRYRDPDSGGALEQERSLAAGEVRGSWKDADASWRMDVAMAEFAEVLRGSPWVDARGLSRVLGLANSASLDQGSPEFHREFLGLVEAAITLRKETGGPGLLETAAAPVPLVLHVRSVYPNPVLSQSTIAFQIPEARSVQLHVFDVQGRLVATLLDGLQPAGDHEIQWAGTGDRGERLGSGVYFLLLSDGDRRHSHKVVLAR